MAGPGTAVGPSLKNIATYALPGGMVVAIRMSSTETVQLVTPHTGPAFRLASSRKQGGAYKFWNLS